MNTDNYCYSYASGYYRGLFKALTYTNIPGVKIEERDKFEAWIEQELDTANKFINNYSNKVSNF